MGDPILIGLVGRKRAGKDTVAGMLFDLAPEKWKAVAFATKLKEICADVYGFNHEQLYGDLKEVPDPRYPRPDGTCLTPREAMEKCGTEFARSCYPNTWRDLGIRLVDEAILKGLNVVVTDVRFANEGVKVKERGGMLWRIIRPSAEAVPSTHISDTEMNRPEMGKLVDRVIYNNGTLDELRANVKKALTS